MFIFTEMRRMGNRFRSLLTDSSGMGTVEIIIIIAVLVTLALIFRGFIMELAWGIFAKIQEKTNEAISGL